MYLGRVEGTALAERKAKGPKGSRLLLVQPLDDDKRPIGALEVAVDSSGTQATKDDLVWLEAALNQMTRGAVDAEIVGVVEGIQRPN